MKIFNIWSILIILLNFLSFFVFRFGMISRCASKHLIEFFGALLLSASFILMLFFFGIVNFFILLMIFWFVVTPLVEVIIERLQKKLYGQFQRQIAEKIRKIKKNGGKYLKADEEGMLEETLPGFGQTPFPGINNLRKKKERGKENDNM